MTKRVLSLASLKSPGTIIEFLRKNGHSVLWVIDVKEALNFINATQFDVVVIAAEQGEQNIEAIANATALFNIPFVVIGAVSNRLQRRAHAVISSSASEKQLLRILSEEH